MSATARFSSKCRTEEVPGIKDGFSLRPAQHQVADLVTDRWAARRVRIGPFFHDQATVPGQQRAGDEDPVPTQVAGE
ncbi:MAG: hypothetical protein ACRDST_12070 [Pseudonocardiaceae bacterium]